MLLKALETSVCYPAHELGVRAIPANAIFAGAVRTRAASASDHFDELFAEAVKKAPLRHTVDVDDVGDADETGRAALLLASDITTHHSAKSRMSMPTSISTRWWFIDVTASPVARARRVDVIVDISAVGRWLSGITPLNCCTFFGEAGADMVGSPQTSSRQMATGALSQAPTLSVGDLVCHMCWAVPTTRKMIETNDK